MADSRHYQTLISATELAAAHRSMPRPVIVDCRYRLGDPEAGRALYLDGHIPNARFADLDRDLASPVTPTSGRHPLPAPGDLITQLRNWGVNNDSQVVCYDDVGGAFAARLWWLLNWLGHRDVAVLDGGIGRWIHAGFGLSVDCACVPAGNFRGRPDHSMWVDVETVENNLAAGLITLSDARSRDRFTGDDSTTDPVAGHVPGAISVPFSENLSDQGTFLSPDRLRQRHADTTVGQTDPVAMCGSGVTACHNLLARRIAGLPMGKLYVGSWSEWIRDPDRPIATGWA